MMNTKIYISSKLYKLVYNWIRSKVTEDRLEFFEGFRIILDRFNITYYISYTNPGLNHFEMSEELLSLIILTSH